MIKLNGHTIPFDEYPNRESMLSIAPILPIIGPFEEQQIMWKYEDDRDIWRLLVLKKHLDEIGCRKVRLAIPYMPYSRMDRPNPVYAFTLKTLCNLINSLGFTTVTVHEPHSNMTCALLDRSTAGDVVSYLLKLAVKEVITDSPFTDNYALCFPDKGAAERYAGRFACRPVLVCDKVRNFSDGRITDLTVNGALDEKTHTVFILDDLCSKGGTFILTAEKVKEKFPWLSRIVLVVAHCEYTIMTGGVPASPLINAVYTSNSILEPSRVDCPKIKINNMFY